MLTGQVSCVEVMLGLLHDSMRFAFASIAALFVSLIDQFCHRRWISPQLLAYYLRPNSVCVCVCLRDRALIANLVQGLREGWSRQKVGP
jgi:hypothetical protein